MIRKTIGTPSACGGGAGDDLHALKHANCCRFRPHSQGLNCLSALYCTESMKKQLYRIQGPNLEVPSFDSLI